MTSGEINLDWPGFRFSLRIMDSESAWLKSEPDSYHQGFGEA